MPNSCIADCSYCPSLHSWEEATTPYRFSAAGEVSPCNIWHRGDLEGEMVLRFNTRMFPLLGDQLEKVAHARIDWVVDGNNFIVDSAALRWALSHCLVRHLVVIPRPTVDYFELFSFLQQFERVPEIQVAPLLDATSLMSWVESCEKWYPKIAVQFVWPEERFPQDFFARPDLESYRVLHPLWNWAAAPGVRTVLRLFFLPFFLLFRLLKICAEIGKDLQEMTRLMHYAPHRGYWLSRGVLSSVKNTTIKIYWSAYPVCNEILRLIRQLVFFLRWKIGWNVFSFFRYLGHILWWEIGWSVLSLCRFIGYLVFWKAFWPLSYVLRKPFYFLRFQWRKRFSSR